MMAIKASNDARAMIRARGVSKTFSLHNQGGVQLPVLEGIDLEVAAGETVVLGGPSGTGKSTFLRILYGNYLASQGQVQVRHGDSFIDIMACEPRKLLNVRRETLGFVSQFLRVIPRITSLDVVMDPMLRRGVALETATERACQMLARLQLPQRLWKLAPATFSGGEQQRVNIARAFVAPAPILLLDEPTASLDAGNRDIVTGLIEEARGQGAAIVGIFHDEAVRERVATRIFDLTVRKAAD